MTNLVSRLRGQLTIAEMIDATVGGDIKEEAAREIERLRNLLVNCTTRLVESEIELTRLKNQLTKKRES